jgi:hypothetical protein
MSAQFSNWILTLPKEVNGLGLRDFEACCRARLTQGIYRVLNGSDRDAKATTLITLRDATYTCNDGAWPLGHFRKSGKWRNFPGHIRMTSKTLTQQNMVISPQSPASPIYDWSIETLMCITGQNSNDHKRLTNLLKSHNKSKLANISPWFQGGSDAWINYVIEDRNHGDIHDLISQTPLSSITIPGVAKIMTSQLNDIIYQGVVKLTEDHDAGRWITRPIQQTNTRMNPSNRLGVDGSAKKREGLQVASMSVVNTDGNIHSGVIEGSQTIRRAELFALLAAVRIANSFPEEHQTTTIFPDSKSDVNFINKHRRKHHLLQWQHISHRSIKKCLVQEITSKIKVKFVKAHTEGNNTRHWLNYQADLAAKDAVEKNTNPVIREQWHNTDSFPLTEGGKLIETNVYKFTLQKLLAEKKQENSQLKSAKRWDLKGVWKYPNRALLNMKQESKKIIVLWKIRTRTLPTLPRMRKRYEWLYTDTLCAMCGEEKETERHIFSKCSQMDEERSTYQRELESITDAGIRIWEEGITNNMKKKAEQNMMTIRIPKCSKRQLRREKGAEYKEAGAQIAQATWKTFFQEVSMDEIIQEILHPDYNPDSTRRRDHIEIFSPPIEDDRTTGPSIPDAYNPFL